MIEDTKDAVVLFSECELKPFDQLDWSAFAGAEGDAYIGEHPDGFIFIVDDKGVTVINEMGEEELILRRVD